MVARLAGIAVACWVIAISASAVYADPFEWIIVGPKKVVSGIARDTKRRNCWPQPFVAPDRQAVRDPFVTMVGHGWRQQNLIADHHFGEGGMGLNEAGRQKVRWILFGVSPQHRAIYVQMDDDPQVTAARLAEVQQLAAQLTPYGEMPVVLQTHIQPQGWPAEWVDAVGRKYHEATPAPILPERKGGTSF